MPQGHHQTTQHPLHLPDQQQGYLHPTTLLTGTLNLHGRRLHFGRPALTYLCPLCGMEAESQCHFISVCPSLQQQRQKLLGPILDMMTPEAATRALADPDMITQVILDHTHHVVKALLRPDLQNLDSKLQFYTGTLCYVLNYMLQIDQPMTWWHLKKRREYTNKTRHHKMHTPSKHVVGTAACNIWVIAMHNQIASNPFPNYYNLIWKC